MKSYRVFLFDADETLFDFQKAEAGALACAFASFGFDCDASVCAQYHRLNDALWKQLETGAVTKEALQWMRFQQLGDALDIRFDPHEMNRRFMQGLSEGAFLLDGAADICHALAAAGKTLCLVTNGTGFVQRKRFARSGLAPDFRAVFISEDIGVPKPQPAFFEAVFRALPEFQPAEMLVVGDSMTADIAGGQAAGLDTCWYNPHGKPNTAAPTYEIHALDELMQFTE